MLILWKGMKVTLGFFTLVALTLTSGLFTVLLYDKYMGSKGSETVEAAVVSPAARSTAAVIAKEANPVPAKPKASEMLDAQVIKQYPELPSGCEVTSLAMLLQYAGISKSKSDLAAEMHKDTAPLRTDANGSIVYWGNPNIGFVGDVTNKSLRGFGIYHAALLPLLMAYVPGAVDLTGKPFDELEKQVASGYPAVVWNTIDYSIPSQWVTWDTDIGPVTTTFAEHAVLLVGYDDNKVYVNDPISGKKAFGVDKAQFIATWEAMGKQALSYTK